MGGFFGRASANSGFDIAQRDCVERGTHARPPVKYAKMAAMSASLTRSGPYAAIPLCSPCEPAILELVDRPIELVEVGITRVGRAVHRLWQPLQLVVNAPGTTPPQVSIGGFVVTGPPVVVLVVLVPPVPTPPVVVSPVPVELLVVPVDPNPLPDVAFDPVPLVANPVEVEPGSPGLRGPGSSDPPMLPVQDAALAARTRSDASEWNVCRREKCMSISGATGEELPVSRGCQLP